jgi:predicted amidohydrolase YtcJ
MDRSRGAARAVAVAGGRIVAVGDDRDMAALVGSRTRVVELRGRTLTPGFIDAHVHPVSSGVEMLRCDLTRLRGLDAYLGRVAAYAAANPDEPWIVGGGWSMADFPGGIPSRLDLDRVVPDRPVYLESRDGHTGWVNSRALEVAGIDATTSDPRDGQIEHDADGEPTGTLQESARDLVVDHLPPVAPEVVLTGLRVAQAELHALGVTGWQDAYVRPVWEDIAYPTLARRGELTARVVGALGWDERRDETQVEELVERRSRTAAPRYAPTSVKFFADGVLENFTGTLLEPYLDAAGRPTLDTGRSILEPEAFGRSVLAVERAGFQTHVHAIGDRAVRETLDAVAAARKAVGPSDSRPHVAHIQLIHPADIGRFRTLDVTANAQADWAALEDSLALLTIPFLGAERAGRIYPFGSLVRAGARLAMGSDWSVSTADPLAQMEVAVNRVSIEHRGQKPPFLRDERIELVTALEAFTLGSAWVNHLEAEVGSIEVGKAADLVVLDRDLFDRGAGAIGEARVVATFIDGVAVHEVPELGG